MGKTLNQISNYPFSNGADAFDNPLLLNNSLALRNKKLQDYLNYLLEISKDIQFFDGDGGAELPRGRQTCCGDQWFHAARAGG